MRRRRASKKDIIPDPKYNNKLVAKLINSIMVRGKKSLAQKIVYTALEAAKEKAKKPNILEVFNKAVDNVRPQVELKSRRIGGATYQVPIDIRNERGQSIALRWIRNAARTRKGEPIAQRLAAELFDAYQGIGAAVKKKEDTHKMAEANKAFAHFRW